MNAAVYGIPDAVARRRISDLADLLELGEELTRPVRKLSLGQRMKAELLAALLHEPEVLFLDEPTLGLDVNAQARVRQFLAEYNRRTGATVLLTSHYMADITALCPRVLLIHQGRLFHDGPLVALADQLAPEREVRLELESPVAADDLAGLGRLEQRLVPRDQLTAVVAQLLDRFPVRDLDVTDPPIEELIGGCSGRGGSDADLRAEPADHPGAAGLPVRPHARVPRRDRLSGVLPFIMLSVWSGSDARSGLGLDGVALDRYFLSAFLVRQFSVVWVVYAFEEDASPYLLQPLHPLWRYVAAHLGEQLTRLPFAAVIAAVFFVVQPQAFWLPSMEAAGHLAGLCHRLSVPEFDCRLLFLE